MVCGHCGTKVADGFSVCAACGAVYDTRLPTRRNRPCRGCNGRGHCRYTMGDRRTVRHILVSRPSLPGWGRAWTDDASDRLVAKECVGMPIASQGDPATSAELP